MISIECHAKINLYLKILGKRPDGYHDIDTVFQSIDLADKLSWVPGEGDPVLNVYGADTGPVEDNLILKAVRLFRNATGAAVGGRFELEKRIPVGGGLGGGSSNAAAILTLLNRHFDSPLSNPEIAQIAARLGSDVPFFLKGGCFRGTGRGEQLQPCDFEARPRRGYLLFPPMGLATAHVYGHYRSADTGSVPCLGYNDLLLPALTVNTAFAEIYRELSRAFKDQPFFMTGSGSTLVLLATADLSHSIDPRHLKALNVAWTPFRFLEKTQLNS